MELVNKFWVFGGWFYLSLIFGVIGYNYFKKFRTIFVKLLLVTAFLVSSYFFIQQIQQRSGDFWLFLTPVEQKLDQQSFYTHSFARSAKQLIPKDNKSSCIYFFFDVETVYLIQELYPLRPLSLDRNQPPTNCQYLIAPGQAKPELAKFLILEDHQNFLYLIK